MQVYAPSWFFHPGKQVRTSFLGIPAVASQIISAYIPGFVLSQNKHYIWDLQRRPLLRSPYWWDLNIFGRGPQTTLTPPWRPRVLGYTFFGGNARVGNMFEKHFLFLWFSCIYLFSLKGGNLAGCYLYCGWIDDTYDYSFDLLNERDIIYDVCFFQSILIQSICKFYSFVSKPTRFLTRYLWLLFSKVFLLCRSVHPFLMVL